MTDRWFFLIPKFGKNGFGSAKVLMENYDLVVVVVVVVDVTVVVVCETLFSGK